MGLVIYTIKNRKNGLRYTGQTRRGAEHRWKGHKKEAQYGCLTSRFHNAIREHGPESFEISGYLELGKSLFDGKSEKEITSILKKLEATLIQVQGLYDPVRGYNSIPGRPKRSLD